MKTLFQLFQERGEKIKKLLQLLKINKEDPTPENDKAIEQTSNEIQQLNYKIDERKGKD